MNSTKFVCGMFVLLILTGLLYAQVPGIQQQSLQDSQVTILPATDNGTLLNISVFAFQPANSTGGTSFQTIMNQIAQSCGGNQTCIQQQAVQITSGSTSYRFNSTPLQNANFIVEYFNPQGNSFTGQWTPVPNCAPIVADNPATAYTPDPNTGTLTPYTYYVAQCDISSVVGGSPRTTIRATFVPAPNQTVSVSSNEFEYSNTNITPTSIFTQNLKDFINSISTSGGTGIGGTLPCVGVFLILGLLMASLYFSGKSPISLLDITTPRLPAPKGPTAGGQILAPYGYGEMKKTASDKMAAAARALADSTNALRAQNSIARDSSTNNLVNQANSLKGTAADAAAGPATGRDRQVAGTLAVLGRVGGMNAGQLQPLVNTLPYHYGDAEHKLVAQILDAAKARGGRDALTAMMVQDYLYGQATLKQLDVLSGHPELGQRSVVHQRISNTLGKFYGANRYNVLSGVVMSGTDSTIRSARVMGRMTKSIVTETPNLARTTARTTMEMLGGRNVVEELEAKGKTSPTAAWLAGQLSKHPSEVVIGGMYPINDKMSQLYKAVRNEALHDEMRYVLKQVYKKMGVRFDINEQELANMGHVDVDILKRSGFTSSAAMAAVEEELRRVLANSTMNSQEKLSALMRVAESHGATIDHQMVNFTRRLDSIEASAQTEPVKMILLQQALEEQNKVRMATNSGGMVKDDAYVCHVGGSSLKGSAVWETMVLRTMIYDGENGHLRGGLKDELVSARLNVANRLASLNPESAMELLPEHMRNPVQLKAVAERNRQDMVSLFTDEGKREFEKYATAKGTSKSISQASISEIVDFMYGGNLPRMGDVDKKTGRMHWWPDNLELSLNPSCTTVDMKRHWTKDIQTREMFQIAAWTEARFSRGNVAAYDAGVEAQVKRLPGYSSMSGEQESQAAKKVWIANELMKDMEQRFNSQFGQNTYGTTRDVMKTYTGIMAGFLEKAMEEKKIQANHPDMQFLEKMDLTSPKDMGKLKDILHKYQKEYNAVISRPMTYDDIARSNKAIVLLQEGGYAYYKKGMVLSDLDRVMAGQAALRDNHGQLRAFIPEDVPVAFGSRDDLTSQYHKLRMSKDTNEWQSFMQSAVRWAKEGGYNFEKEKVLGAVLWEYGTKTHDYDSFWKNSAITVEAKRQVTPVTPSILRMFGVEAPGLMKAMTPFRDIAMAGGDMVSKVAIGAGGPVLTSSYNIASVGAAYRMHSFELTKRIVSGQDLDKLTDKEAASYRNYAAMHGAYAQAAAWAIDRSPFGYSTSHGTNAADAAMFAHGPGLTFKKQDYIGAVMDQGSMRSFNIFYGWPMDLARKMIAPYATSVSTAQKEMVGRAGRWDTTGDPFRMLHHSEPRVRSAMQAFFNPLSLSNSKLANKLNLWKGTSSYRQVGGEDVMLGLRAGPQDVWLARSGLYTNARTGDVNPRESYYDYRMVKHLDAPMAHELMKDPTFRYQKDIADAANETTVRRTVSAETLAMKRQQELMSFSSLQTPQGKFYSPIHFAASVLGIPDMISKQVAKSKYGYSSGSVGDSMKRSVKNMSDGLSSFTKPGRAVWEVRCGKCGAKNYRYNKCGSCGTSLY